MAKKPNISKSDLLNHHVDVLVYANSKEDVKNILDFYKRKNFKWIDNEEIDPLDDFNRGKLFFYVITKKRIAVLYKKEQLTKGKETKHISVSRFFNVYYGDYKYNMINDCFFEEAKELDKTTGVNPFKNYIPGGIIQVDSIEEFAKEYEKKQKQYHKITEVSSPDGKVVVNEYGVKVFKDTGHGTSITSYGASELEETLNNIQIGLNLYNSFFKKS